jgi:MarR family transcriptional regulator, protease production regulatory protein HPr
VDGMEKIEKKTRTLKETLIFGHKMAILSKALWKAIEKDWQEWIKPFDLNINEHHILLIAHHLKGASISEISKFGVMHVSTAFNFSKSLEERGLLTFSKKENDKRNTYVKLTEKGEKLLFDAMEVYDIEKNSVVKGALPLAEHYGKFPEMLDMVAIIREIYGEEYMMIFDRTIQNILVEYSKETQEV